MIILAAVGGILLYTLLGLGLVWAVAFFSSELAEELEPPFIVIFWPLFLFAATLGGVFWLLDVIGKSIILRAKNTRKSL